jgi:mycoredoxin
LHGSKIGSAKAAAISQITIGMSDQITVYGAMWCGDTRRTLRQLDRSGVGYEYVDIDDDDAAERKVIAFNNGKRRIPLVEISSETGTKCLSVPSESELKSAIN